MNKLFCLVGKSGCGKDTILNHLCNKYGVRKAVSYTTRPSRKDEVNGINYNFVTEQEMQAMIESNNIIEINKFNTKNGIWLYGTHKNIINQLEHNNLICIKEPNGVKKLINELGYKNVIPIIIEADGVTRLKRCLNREDCDESIIYEICRRYLSDENDFNTILKEDLYRIENNSNIVSCTDRINEYIESGKYKYFQCTDDIKVGDTVLVSDIRNKEKGNHLLSRIGDIGSVYSFINYEGEKRYRILFKDNHTYYFRRSELERI